jgi:hypothetical protein
MHPRPIFSDRSENDQIAKFYSLCIRNPNFIQFHLKTILNSKEASRARASDF